MSEDVRAHFQKHKKQLPEPIAKITASDPNPTSLANLIQRLEEKLDSKQIAIVKELGHSIGTTGMNLDDSCLLARITREELDNLCFLVPEVKIYLKLKQTEYKQGLLAVISNQALQNGDVKMSMWLLEKQYAEEYDSSVKKDIAKASRSEEGDMLAVAFAMVRRKSSETMPINERAGDMEDRAETKIYDVKEILS